MNLDTALRRASARLHRTEPRYRPARIQELGVVDRQVLAAYISGSTQRSSVAYRTAMREIQRLERGQIRNVGPQYLSKFNAYLNYVARTRIVVDFSGIIRISNDVEHRTIRNIGAGRWTLHESVLASPGAFENPVSGFFAAYFGQINPPMFIADPPASDAVDVLVAEYV